MACLQKRVFEYGASLRERDLECQAFSQESECERALHVLEGENSGHCNSAHCNTLQAATPSTKLQLTALHYNTLQNAATRYIQ